MTAATLTPPELAKCWRVKAEKIIAWIRRGELRAFDVSATPGVGRPQYRIPIDAIVEFEQRRSGRQEKPERRKRRQATQVISFIK